MAPPSDYADAARASKKVARQADRPPCFIAPNEDQDRIRRLTARLPQNYEFVIGKTQESEGIEPRAGGERRQLSGN
jgi:hypothetical protein